MRSASRRGARARSCDRARERAVIYLDHNAITPVRPEARDAVLLALESFGNPSSVHRAGRDARDARPAEVVFTSGATEGAALAIRGVLGAAPAGRRRLVVTAVEHPCVLALSRALAASGTPLTVVPVDRRGEVGPERGPERRGIDLAAPVDRHDHERR